MSEQFFVGVDVGTGSARAGVFDAAGTLKGTARRRIEIWHAAGSVVEQSSDQIWQAVSESVREAVAAAGVPAEAIAGVGFDATCSLVAVAADGSPVPVGPSGEAQRNVIVWMDHRASGEAAEINAGGHAVLDYVGGRISPEMETPKLLWLKRNRPADFARAGHFFDLADYLTWRATGSLARSVCTLTCKWTYLAHEKRFDPAYFVAIGLGELAEEGFSRIGQEVVEPGTPLASGLSAAAAKDLGLKAGTPVGAGLIDAHAGGIGTLGGRIGDAAPVIDRRLAYIFGTSACSMASNPEPIFVDGVWGPYFSSMVPGLWLTEGGQSAAGAAIDHLVTLHPAAAEARASAEADGVSLVEWLDRQASAGGRDVSRAAECAGGIHVVPEFLGNRSPLADPEARAVIAGIGLEGGIDDLVALYIAGLCGIGYGLRQLVAALEEKGMAIETIVASGGAARSPFVRQLLADATGRPVAVPRTEEPVLLGAAMLGVAAAQPERGLADIMTAMSGFERVHEPAGGTVTELHRRRYEAFVLLQEAGRRVRTVMSR